MRAEAGKRWHVRIVVLDDVVLYKEQICALEAVGELTIYKGAPASREEILFRARDADIIISGWTQYPDGILEELPQLKLISLWSTGTDYIDLDAARRAGVKVKNVPGYASNAVAELAFGLMLAVLRKIPSANGDIRKTGALTWQKFEGSELAGKSLGILGTGAIGLRAARIAKAFDMKVFAFDIHKREDLEAEGVLEYVAFDDVFSRSDIITLHMPLLPETRGLISHRELSRMPRHGVFINTARAGLVDQEALIRSLEDGVLAGAGLDDIDIDHPNCQRLLAMNQVVLTPHIGFYTKEATQTKTHICVENVMTFIADGKAMN